MATAKQKTAKKTAKKTASKTSNTDTPKKPKEVAQQLDGKTAHDFVTFGDMVAMGLIKALPANSDG